VVVDRLLVRPGIEKRLEASIETATKLANGLVLIVVVNGDERLYSQKLACMECGTSVPVLEPRSFSFNSPYGACETCAGLGNRWAFDPGKVIVDSSKPMLEGGLGPGAGSTFMSHSLEEAAKLFKIKLSTPFESFPKKTQKLLIEGGNGFAGILGILRQLRQASDEYREWLTDYMSPIVCEPVTQAASSGQPGGAHEGHVHRGTHRHANCARGDCGARLALDRSRITNRRACFGQIPRRLEFLNVGLDYLSLDGWLPRTGGESQRIRLATQTVPVCAACCTCWTSPPSDCIIAITMLLETLTASATWATRWWWWSMTETIERADGDRSRPSGGWAGGVGAARPDCANRFAHRAVFGCAGYRIETAPPQWPPAFGNRRD
jgi:excinuclease ABC subunit A